MGHESRNLGSPRNQERPHLKQSEKKVLSFTAQWIEVGCSLSEQENRRPRETDPPANTLASNLAD